MSPNKQRRKGDDWERQAVKLLNEYVKGSDWVRVAGSGALGTIVSEPILMGDIRGRVSSFPKKFKGEAKVGYSNRTGGEAKSFTLMKEWLDKIHMQAEADYATPFLIGKFSGVRDGVKAFVVLEIDEFVNLLNYVTELKENMNE